MDGITVASSKTVRNLGVISEQSVSIKLNVMLLFTCTNILPRDAEGLLPVTVTAELL